MELVQEDTLPERVELVLRVRVGRLGGDPGRGERRSVLDLAEEDFGLAVALLDRAVTRRRAAVKLQVQLCSQEMVSSSIPQGCSREKRIPPFLR